MKYYLAQVATTGSYADLQNKPVLLQAGDVTTIVESGNFNHTIDGVNITSGTAITITTQALMNIFKHATQAAHDALPAGTVIMWSSARGANLDAFLSTGKWDIFYEMQGRFPVAAAERQIQKNGLTIYAQGCNSGTCGQERVTLQASQMPSHSHTALYTQGVRHGDNNGNSFAPISGFTPGTVEHEGQKDGARQGDGGRTNNSGGDSNGNTVAHENRPPYYGLIFLIKVK